MAAASAARAPAMTLERVDAKLSLLAYEIVDMVFALDRERALLEADHLLDVRNLITKAAEPKT